MGVEAGDRFCNPLPLYHTGGTVCGSLVSIVRGVTVIWLGEAFDPLTALETLRAERCPGLHGSANNLRRAAELCPELTAMISPLCALG